MQVAPTLPLVIGDDRPQAERRELRLGEHRTPAVASVVPPKRSAQAEPRESGSRCWLSGITAAAAKRRGDSARGNLHSRSKPYNRGLTQNALLEARLLRADWERPVCHWRTNRSAV
jgi:hypothetical protein